MRSLLFLCSLVALLLQPTLQAADPNTFTDPQGRTRFRAPAAPEELRNAWPEAEETAFWDRAQPVIAAYKGKANPRS